MLVFLVLILFSVVGCGDKSVIVSFNTLGGEMIEPITFNIQDTIDFPTPSRPGYRFDGWYVDEALTIPLNSINEIKSSITLYAKWLVEIDDVVISFNTHGGTLVEPLIYRGILIIDKPEDPMMEGHTFSGWFTDEALLTPYIWQIEPTTSLTLHASWTKNSYTIDFVTHEGSFVVPLTFTFGDALLLDNLTLKAGYSFVGWYIDNSLNQPFLHTVMPAYNITLYAKWEKDLVTITFDSVGGSPINPISGEGGSVITWPNQPQKEYFMFCGWFLDINDDESFQATVYPESSIVLYAKWATEGLIYSLTDNDTAYEVGIGNDLTLLSVIIPSHYEGLPVTKIMDLGFSDAEFMNSITLPYTLKHIGNRAFMYASSLKTIHFPDHLESIGQNVFRFCYALESITVSIASVNFKSIDGVLFNYDMTKLLRYPQQKDMTTYHIPSSVKTIEEDAFSDADNLVSLDLGTGVTLIKSHAFFRMSALKTIVIPNQVETIELYAFRECSALESIILGLGLSEIPSYFCDACVSLKEIIIPYQILAIRYGAFNDCINLTHIYILRTSLNGLITGGLYMFTNTPSTMRIYFADQMTLNDYTVAYYWSSYASKMLVGSPIS